MYLNLPSGNMPNWNKSSMAATKVYLNLPSGNMPNWNKSSICQIQTIEIKNSFHAHITL